MRFKMNDLTKEKMMTIKDFCDLTGRRRITITTAINKIMPGKIKNGITTFLNSDESTELLKELRLKDLPNLSKKEQVGKVSEISIISNIMMQFIESQNKFNLELIKEIKSIKQNNQIEFKQDYYSILGYMNLKKIDEARFSEMICYGKEASKISRELNKDIRKIPDERFGQTNSYHIEVLKKVFEV
jgi:hypothetical protein